MTADATSPATKADIAMIMEQFAKMYEVHEKWKNDLEEKVENLKDHFDVTVENIRYDLTSANKEKISVLEDGHKEHGKRIRTVERVVGIA